MEIPVPGAVADADEVCHYLRFAPPDVVLAWLASPPGHQHRVTARRAAESLALVACGVPPDEAWAAACALHQTVEDVRTRLLVAGVREDVAQFAAAMSDRHLPRLEPASPPPSPERQLDPGYDVAKTLTGGGRKSGWSADDVPLIPVPAADRDVDDGVIAFLPGQSAQARSLGLSKISPTLPAGGGGNSMPVVGIPIRFEGE